MSTFNLCPLTQQQFFTSMGGPLAGGKLYTYQAGTSVPQATYSSPTGAIQNANPIVLDASGHVPTEIWADSGVSLKIVIQDSLGNPQGITLDNLSGINDPSFLPAYSEWIASGVTPIYSSASQFSTATNSLGIFTVGRRIRSTVTAGTVYGYVTSAVGSGPTTVNVTMDSTGLDSGLIAVSVGLLSEPSPSVPNTLPYSFQATALTASSGNIAATAGAVTANGNITSALGSVVATAGNVIAGGQFTGPGTGITGTAANLTVKAIHNPAYFSYYNTAALAANGIINYQTASVTAVGASNSSGTVTVTVAGTYFITATAVINTSSAAGAGGTLTLYHNGVGAGVTNSNTQANGSSVALAVNETVSLSAILTLAANDTVAINFTINTATTSIPAGSGSFSAFRLPF